MQEPARQAKRQRKQGTLRVPRFSDQLCFLVVQQLHHRYLVGGALLAARVGLLDVGAALHAALKRQAVAHLHFCDLGGGGTIAKYVANRGIPVLDIGVPVLSMHSPFEVIHKTDLYMAYRTFSLFCQNAE